MQVIEKLLILHALLLHPARLELDQQLLDVLFPLLLALTMPGMQLLPQTLVLRVLPQLLLDLVLGSCLIVPVHVLVEVEVEELLLDTFFKLVPLLQSQPSESNLFGKT